MADNGQTETFQGVINSTDGLPGYFIVNERKLLVDGSVTIKDAKEKEAAIKDLKNGKWVYITAEKKAAGLTATHIYLIPKRIKNKDKVNYPFIKKVEETDE